MKKSAFLIAPALALGALALSTSPAFAHDADSTTYQANLASINGSNASGTFMLTLHGDQATVTEKVSGLAATFNGNPYPHVQHIHIGAKGTCPDVSADTNKDGVISTTEGAPFYGGIGTTLSTTGDTSPAAGTDLKVAPSGASYTYTRTFTVDAKTSEALKAGTGVVVVHGLDPATLSDAAQKAPSDLVPSLPLAATSPALCGPVKAMPAGAPGTGITTPAPAGPDLGLLAAGGGLVLAAGGAYAARRKMSTNA
ncbi:hypothetical protein ABLI39_07865 [Pseudarthrobacter sp. B907]|uniref:hypothetical protein n=1 Tax=Pseudarthrobacter sp. B907 TaxID=3158261 RepID=UPI0032DA4785